MLTKLLTTEAGIMATIAFVLILTGLVMLVIQIVKKKQEQKHSRLIYYLFVSGLLFFLFLPFPKGLKYVVHQYWYSKLINIRGERIHPDPGVVELTISDSLDKNRLLKVLQFIDNSKPKAIGLYFNVIDFGVNSHAELSNSVKNAQLIYLRPTNDDGQWLKSAWNMNSLSINNEWIYSGGYGNDDLYSMYYKMCYSPRRKIQFGGGFGFDPFIVKIVRQAIPNADQLLNSIPLNNDGLAIINKYSNWYAGWDDERPSIYIDAKDDKRSTDISFRGVRVRPNDQIFSESYYQYYKKNIKRYSSVDYRFDMEKQSLSLLNVISEPGKLARFVPSVPADTVWSISGLEGKIIIIRFWSQSYMFYREHMYPKIQNILDQDFLWDLDTRTYPVICLISLILFYFIYSRFEPWKGLGIIAGMVILCLGIAAILFFTSKLLFNPYPIVASFLGMIVFMLPYELATERIRLITERMRLSAQLKAAHDLQMGLMPSADPIIPGYDVSGLCQPANEVGGDYYDYVWLDDEKRTFGIAIADVSGKAMDAAMTAVMTSGMVYQEIGNYTSPKDILRKMNRPMYLKTDRRVFTAMSFAVIDTNGKTLTFSNAGQMQPMLRRGDELQMLKTSGPHLPLGATERVEYGEELFALSSGDLLVFYTDGIIEAMNTRSELFGFERLQSTVKGSPNTNSAKKIVEQIFADVQKFTGSAPQHDDMTVVVVKVL